MSISNFLDENDKQSRLIISESNGKGGGRNVVPEREYRYPCESNDNSTCSPSDDPSRSVECFTRYFIVSNKAADTLPCF